MDGALLPAQQDTTGELEPSREIFRTPLGAMIVDDCLTALRGVLAQSVDLVVTSPSYDGQSKYGNGEKYERDWYEETFLAVTAEVYRGDSSHGKPRSLAYLS